MMILLRIIMGLGVGLVSLYVIALLVTTFTNKHNAMSITIIAIVTLTATILGAIFIPNAIVEKNAKEVEVWNNGTCAKCGSMWHLVSVDTPRRQSTHYYFACEHNHLFDTTINFFE